MPIEIRCPKCTGKFRVPEKYAGKRVKCPKCQGTIAIPGFEGRAIEKSAPAKPRQAPAKPGQAPAKPDQKKTAAKKQPLAVKPAPEPWYLQTEQGEQYGPVSRKELEAWVAEGRIDASCQVLRDGWDQWKWAEEVFPELAEVPTESDRPAVVATDEKPHLDLDTTPPKTRVTTPLEPHGEPAKGRSDADSGEGGAVTRGTRRALKETKPWVTFLAILGFIFGGLGAVGGLITFALMALAGGLQGAVIGMTVFVGPAVALVMAYYLFSYGQRIYAYLRSEKPRDLEVALVAQKSFWKLAGIVTAAVLAFYLLAALTIFVLLQQAASSLQNLSDMPGQF